VVEHPVVAGPAVDLVPVAVSALVDPHEPSVDAALPADFVPPANT